MPHRSTVLRIAYADLDQDTGDVHHLTVNAPASRRGDYDWAADQVAAARPELGTVRVFDVEEVHPGPSA